MAARIYGGSVAVRTTSKKLTELLATLYPGFKNTVFSTISFRGHFNNVDRIYLVVDGQDADYVVPNEPLDWFLPYSPVYTDSISFRAANDGDVLLVVAIEA